MVIKLCEPVFGIKWWAMWYQTTTPRFELFKHIGSGSDGVHYFKSKSKGTIIGFTESQLLGGSLKPFLIRCQEANLATAS